ncbi:hypothetical protein BH23CHL2_BH23CHL2_00410 [soil metagenome]
MRLFSIRSLLALFVLGLLFAGCDVELQDDNGDAPTAIVITSTPASPDHPDPTPTSRAEEWSPTTTATEGTEAVKDPATATPNVPNASPTATPADSQDSTNQARAEIEDIEQAVVEIRGLEVLEDLDVQIIDRQELVNRIETILAEEYSEEEARIDALSYWLLRLIPDETLDLYQLQVDLLSEQVAGYYDPDTKELVVVTESGELSVTDKVTMAHEIVHALQDQHFDLIEIDELATDADRGVAITALIEGDATFAMTEYLLGYLDPLELAELLAESLTAGDTQVLDSAPRYVSEGLLFSYEAGQSFVTEIHNNGGYAAIDQALNDPPTSTEQIIHPEKYIGPNRDEPIDVQNPDVSEDLGAGWELLRSDVLGEWDFQIMLEENGATSPEATRAAAGWGGSRFDIYESDTGTLALLTTRWDTDEDASEFAGALLASFQSNAVNGGIWSESNRHFSVVASGDTVVMISGTDREAVERVLAVMEQTV